MAYAPLKESWVVYTVGSGAVHAVYFQEPKSVPYGKAVVKANLSEKDIQNPHRLRVQYGKVVRFPVRTL